MKRLLTIGVTLALMMAVADPRQATGQATQICGVPVEQFGPRQHTMLINAALDHTWAILRELDIELYLATDRNPSGREVLVAMSRSTAIPGDIRETAVLSLQLASCLGSDEDMLRGEIEGIDLRPFRLVLNEAESAEQAVAGLREITPETVETAAVTRIIGNAMAEVISDGLGTIYQPEVTSRMPWLDSTSSYALDLAVTDGSAAAGGAVWGCLIGGGVVNAAACGAGALTGAAAGAVPASIGKIFEDLFEALR